MCYWFLYILTLWYSSAVCLWKSVFPVISLVYHYKNYTKIPLWNSFSWPLWYLINQKCSGTPPLEPTRGFAPWPQAPSCFLTCFTSDFLPCFTQVHISDFFQFCELMSVEDGMTPSITVKIWLKCCWWWCCCRVSGTVSIFWLCSAASLNTNESLISVQSVLPSAAVCITCCVSCCGTVESVEEHQAVKSKLTS